MRFFWYLVLVQMLLLSFCSFGTPYYVNNNSLTGDRWCTAIGAAGNTGLTKNSPKALLSQVVALAGSLTANDTVYVDAGTYTDAVTFTSTDQGTSSGRLVIKGAGKTVTIIQPSTTAHAIYLNNADYIKFEGIQFQTTSNATKRTAFYIYDDSDNNIIDNCYLLSAATSGFSNDVVQNVHALGLSSASTTNHPDNNTIQNCDIEGSKYTIYIKGYSTTAGQRASGNVLDGNIITVTNVSSAIYESNYIYFTDQTVIKRNKFQGFYTALHLNRTSATAPTSDQNINLSIFNNYFSSAESTSSEFCALHFHHANTTSSNIRIYNNTFYFENGSWGMIHTMNASAPLGVKVYNNAFFVPTTASASTGYSQLIYNENGTTMAKFDSIDYNYYGTGGYDLAWVTTSTGYSTLATWKGFDHDARASKSGDANSYSDATISDPKFVAPGSHNLDLQTTSPLLAKAPNIWSISNDINNTTRPTSGATPFAIGADDYSSNLPVKFGEYELGRSTDLNVRVSWTTLSEINADYFIIEKSLDGRNFFPVGHKQANGFSLNNIDYSFTDLNNETGVLYYRILQYDLDGTLASQTITKSISISEEPELYSLSSLGENNFKIQFLESSTGIVKTSITDIQGRVLLQENINLNETGHMNINLKDYPEGIYLLKLSSEKEDDVIKLIKR